MKSVPTPVSPTIKSGPHKVALGVADKNNASRDFGNVRACEQ